MPFVAKVQVVPEPGAASQVAAAAPASLSDSDLQNIADVVRESVQALQNSFTKVVPPSSGFAPSEIELQFGINLEGQSKIPIIGPLLGIGVKAGATFQVTIKLAQSQ
jgi:hypothetical protein